MDATANVNRTTSDAATAPISNHPTQTTVGTMTPGSDPDLSPALQCDHPSCEREAVNPTAHGPNACPAHYPDNDTHKAEQHGESDLNPTEKATPTTSTPTPGDDTGSSTVSISPDCAQAALDDAITWVHNRINDEISHHHNSGNHPDRSIPARDWFHELRGFDGVGQATTPSQPPFKYLYDFSGISDLITSRQNHHSVAGSNGDLAA